MAVSLFETLITICEVHYSFMTAVFKAAVYVYTTVFSLVLVLCRAIAYLSTVACNFFTETFEICVDLIEFTWFLTSNLIWIINAVASFTEFLLMFMADLLWTALWQALVTITYLFNILLGALHTPFHILDLLKLTISYTSVQALLYAPLNAFVYLESIIRVVCTYTARVIFHMPSCAADMLKELNSYSVFHFREVFDNSVVQHGVLTILNIYQQSEAILTAFIQQVYFHNLPVLFGGPVKIIDAGTSGALLPLQLLFVIIKDMTDYVSFILNIFLCPFGWNSQNVSFKQPLPDIQLNIYCVFEEFLTIVILYIKQHLIPLLVWTLFAAFICHIIKKKYFSAHYQLSREAFHFRTTEALPEVHHSPSSSPNSPEIDQNGNAVSNSELVTHHSSGDFSPSTSAENLIPVSCDEKSEQGPSGRRSNEAYITQLQKQLHEERERALCVVCQDRSRNVLLLPCRHACVCDVCVTQILLAPNKTCPVCRARICDVMTIFV